MLRYVNEYSGILSYCCFALFLIHILKVLWNTTCYIGFYFNVLNNYMCFFTATAFFICGHLYVWKEEETRNQQYTFSHKNF
jgi:hypothetical protein